MPELRCALTASPAEAQTLRIMSTTGFFPKFDALAAAQEGILLLVHGEVTDPTVDFFDREKVFIERHLKPLLQQLPDLKVTLALTLAPARTLTQTTSVLRASWRT